MLNDGVLDARFGYVFHRQWIQPYESVVSMLWKLGRANLMSGHAMFAQVSADGDDPYRGIAIGDLRVPAMARLLQVGHGPVRDGMMLPFGESVSIRYCQRCISLGYHSVVHQRLRYDRCPIHSLPLLQGCRSCGRSSLYHLDAQLLDAPFRCRHCRARYSAKPVTPSDGWKELTRDQRIAVTRAAIG